MIQILKECSTAGFQPETVLGVVIVHEVWKKHKWTLKLRSGTEGDHSPGSLHYVGFAADLRIWGIPREKLRVAVRECRAALGNEWDVVLEKTHVHFEFQPKVNK